MRTSSTQVMRGFHGGGGGIDSAADGAMCCLCAAIGAFLNSSADASLRAETQAASLKLSISRIWNIIGQLQHR